MSDQRTESLLQQDLSLPRLYRILAARWFWLPLAVVAGGLIGLAASLTLSPAYRATASLGIAVDYGRTHPLDAAAERSALLQAQELLLADETLEQVIGAAPDNALEGAGIATAGELRPLIRLDRFENRWDLSVTSTDPGASAELANAWAQVSVDRLRAALEAALRARALQGRIYELGCRLETAEDSGAAVWRCQRGEAGEFDELPVEVVEQVEASHGVLPGLSFAQLRQAAPPSQPIYRGRTGLLLGSALAGLAAGLLLLLLVPARPA